MGDAEQNALSKLDARLAAATRGWPIQVRDRLAQFIFSQRRESGGFAGKAGPADIYYTAWAMRGLWLIDHIDEPTRAAAREYLAATLPTDIIELTSWLIAYVAAQGDMGPARLEPPLRSRLVQLLLDARAADGGFARSKRGVSSSTYSSFLAVLALQMLGERLAAPQKLAEFVASRRRADEGFAESVHGRTGSVNPTAAAVGILLSVSQPPASTELLEGACRFLAGCQDKSGGFLAFCAHRNQTF